MTIMEEILQEYGLKYEELTEGEKQEVHAMVGAIQESQVTPETLKDSIKAMRVAVEQELVKPDTDTKQDLYLKARLRNYLLIESLLESPEKARKEVEMNIKNYKGLEIL